jgi:hypothetical protein
MAKGPKIQYDSDGSDSDDEELSREELMDLCKRLTPL